MVRKMQFDEERAAIVEFDGGMSRSAGESLFTLKHSTLVDRERGTITQHPSCLAYALAYAGKDWQVIPLHCPKDEGCSCGDPDCRSIGKHPRTRNGLKDATTDENMIRAWWQRWPDASVGIVTGEASGLLVVDVDARSGGLETWERLCEKHDHLPVTPIANTSAGGFHVYYERPQAARVQRIRAWRWC